jgi:hypothetical protein
MQRGTKRDEAGEQGRGENKDDDLTDGQDAAGIGWDGNAPSDVWRCGRVAVALSGSWASWTGVWCHTPLELRHVERGLVNSMHDEYCVV